MPLKSGFGERRDEKDYWDGDGGQRKQTDEHGTKANGVGQTPPEVEEEHLSEAQGEQIDRDQVGGNVQNLPEVNNGQTKVMPSSRAAR